MALIDLYYSVWLDVISYHSNANKRLGGDVLPKNLLSHTLLSSLNLLSTLNVTHSDKIPHSVHVYTHLMTFIQMGLGLRIQLRLGDIRESGETGDSREEEDTK